LYIKYYMSQLNFPCFFPKKFELGYELIYLNLTRQKSRGNLFWSSHDSFLINQIWDFFNTQFEYLKKNMHKDLDYLFPLFGLTIFNSKFIISNLFYFGKIKISLEDFCRSYRTCAFITSFFER